MLLKEVAYMNLNCHIKNLDVTHLIICSPILMFLHFPYKVLTAIKQLCAVAALRELFVL